MQTRNRAKRKQQSTGTLEELSQDGVDLLLERANPMRKLNGTGKELFVADGPNAIAAGKSWVPSKSDQCVSTCQIDTSNAEVPGRNTLESINLDMRVDMQNHARALDGRDDSDWEDGLIPQAYSTVTTQSEQVNGVTIEFDGLPSSAKQNPMKRATAKDKEVAELVHKVHLLCLLGRGRLIDNACNQPLIQAALLSLLPSHLLKISECTKLTVNALAPLFHSNFHVRSSSREGVPFQSALATALETREGTPEEVAALSVALFRALNLTARFVSIVDVMPLKPELDKPSMLDCDVKIRKKDIFDSSTLMVTRPHQESTNCAGSSSIGEMKTDSGEPENEHLSSGMMQDEKSFAGHELKTSVSSASKAKIAPKEAKQSIKKGDLEFERQLEMAFSATAVVTPKTTPATDMNLSPNCPSVSSPFKRSKKITEGSTSSSQGISIAIGSRKVGAPLYWAEIYCSGGNMTGKWVHVDAVNAIIDGEHKVEAAAASCKKCLRYVVAFAGNGAKDVTRRYCMKWYKISSKRVNSLWWDTVLGPLKELESGATGGTVFLDQHELGSSSLGDDFDRREGQNGTYDIRDTDVPENSDSDAKASRKRYPPERATRHSSMSCRSSLEDMELETRALTEPLPSNQQAYRNHQLYAIEKWLTKYQILHPRGPVLGYCSGSAVYPRSCVQMLHTKERWLREGLQVREGELPAKVVKSITQHQQGQIVVADPQGTVPLYGKWQTEPLCLPCAVNGIVPKNERGQVDVWSEKCLPPGTVHLRLPRLVRVAKRLGIDFAPAMVGFEFRNGRSFPVYEGLVICSEFKEAILESYAEEESRREEEEKKRAERAAISRWYQLLSSMMTRQKLNDSYGASSQTTAFGSPKSKDLCPAQFGEDKRMPTTHQVNDQETKLPVLPTPSDNHEHIFLKEDESYDEETFLRHKRCRCGFTIEVEEL
ncbi:DNA repair protein RAD4-like protein [Drosera capensis]